MRPADEQGRFDAWLDLLAKWNRTYNLTAIRDRAQMVTHHVNDALAILPHLPQSDSLRVLDIGTGAGVPGIPIAIIRPRWQLVLLDSNHKKIAFVTQAVAELGLGNVTAVAARAEAWRSDAPFDVVVSRAFADLASFARIAARHVAPDGLIVAMKGAYPAGELAALPPEFEVRGTPRLEVPGVDARRHLVVMRSARAYDASANPFAGDAPDTRAHGRHAPAPKAAGDQSARGR